MRAARLLVAALALAACGVKAPPRPPGVPAAKRGDPEPPCPGCVIPSPDSLPSPSVPQRDEDDGGEADGQEDGATPTVEPPEGEPDPTDRSDGADA